MRILHEEWYIPSTLSHPPGSNHENPEFSDKVTATKPVWSMIEGLRKLFKTNDVAN